MKSAQIKAATAQAKLDAVLDLIAVTPLKPSAADKRAEKSAKAVRDMVADQTKPIKKATKPLDVPAEDVEDHAQEVTGYQGPMKALRDRVKAGLYTKAANGQPSCNDEVAQILGSLEPVEVIKACQIAMDLKANPYAHLNIGQQSMNLRNKLRGAIKRGEFGMGVLREAVEVVMEGRPAKEATPAPAPAPEVKEEPAPAPKKMKRAPKPKAE